MKKLISKNILEDMQLLYVLDTERNIVGLCIAPSDTEVNIEDENRVINVQSLVECKIIGDNYSGNYFGGLSMKYSDTTFRLHYSKQEISRSSSETYIRTFLKADDGIEVIHTVSHIDNAKYITVSTEFINNSDKPVTLEMLSSFAIYGVSPFLDGAGENSMLLHRLRSKWSMEGKLISEPFEDLMLEDCWCYGNSFNVRFGQVGSMPVKDYFPFAAVEDLKNHIIWGAQMGSPSSWQMEITRGDDCACISGGIADREFGHWKKTILVGESFKPISAVLSVCKGNIDDISARLVSAQEDMLNIPKCEEDLPIIFNEYCTTWGCPSHDNISSILNAIDGICVDYFVIDCGWYKAEGVPWYCSMGDYEPSAELFPYGLDKTVDLIQSHGMRPGIWFEFENVGSKANAYNLIEHMLKRDGIPLTTVNRRFWDMNDTWVQNYLQEHVIDFLKKYNFGYMKVDYNETIGIGCDDVDSLGEGLRKNMNATVEFFKKIRCELPDFVLENCASGGNRLEPTFMSLTSMASFSDAHECVEIPIIAANLHRAILPRQSQIWCVIRKADTLQRIAYSVSATFLGRMCLSGDVTELSSEQRNVIKDGIAFYKKAVPFIKNGKSTILSNRSKSDRHPDGYQAVLRKNENGALLVIHTFDNAPDSITVPLGDDYKITDIYSDMQPNLSIYDKCLTLKSNRNFSGLGIILSLEK
jgi:alpha-galactosidase